MRLWGACATPVTAHIFPLWLCCGGISRPHCPWASTNTFRRGLGNDFSHPPCTCYLLSPNLNHTQLFLHHPELTTLIGFLLSTLNLYTVGDFCSFLDGNSAAPYGIWVTPSVILFKCDSECSLQWTWNALQRRRPGIPI
jgi:hypothetical protein